MKLLLALILTSRLVFAQSVDLGATFPSGGSGTVTGVTASSPLASSGGTAPNISLTGIVPILNGGTGQSTANTAFNALAPSQATNSGKFLTTNGSNTSWATIVSGVSSVTASAPLASSGGATPDISCSIANTSQSGCLSSADWNIFNNKFDLPSLTAGSILFSDGVTIAQNNSNLFWDNVTSSLQILGNFVLTKSTTDAPAIGALISATTNTTVDGSNNTEALQTSVTVKVQSGATNDKDGSSAVFTTQRGDGTDDGTLDGMSGVTSLMFHDSGSSGVTNKSYGFSSVLITLNGTLSDHYDFYSERAPAGGTLTNHYGVYIKGDGATPVKNFLSGSTVLGGSSFQTPITDVNVIGGLYVSNWLRDSSNVNSADPNQRLLEDNAGLVSLGWNERRLQIASGNTTVDWGIELLKDASNFVAVDWQNRKLNDSSGNDAFTWAASDAIEIMDRHIKSSQSGSTTIAADAGAGTGASASLSSATDVAGKISITTGTIGISTGSYATVTFASAYSVAPICILTPSSSTLSTSVYVTSTTTTMSINFAIAGGVTSTYSINYHCMETQ